MREFPERYIYPAIFSFEEDGVSVEFPDLDGCFTGGSDLQEAYRLAQDVLAGYLSILEEDAENIPVPALDQHVETESNERVMLVDAWMPPYRENYADRSVNKTVTLPRWLKNAAEERKINFSRVLQEGLMHQLGISVPRHLKDIDQEAFPLVDPDGDKEVVFARSRRIGRARKRRKLVGEVKTEKDKIKG